MRMLLSAAALLLSAAAEAKEPKAALLKMTDGRGVVEDYRAVQLSLRIKSRDFH